MLSFATEFPIEGSSGADEFLLEIKDWILKSPHTNFVEDDFVGMEGERWSASSSDEKIDVLSISTAADTSSAVRFSKVEKGLEWETNIVFSKQPLDTWVSIRVSCESNHPSVQLPPAKKPILVRKLLERFGGALDGSLGVSQSAHKLKNDDVDLASGLITGESKCRLPIVYVSSGFQGKYVVESDLLAKELAGMAHILVEPNRAFSLRLKFAVDSENVYGGTIGVYWPDGGGRRAFFIGQQYDNASEISRGIFEEVRAALANRRSMTRCTWASVQEVVSRRAYNALKAEGSQEIDKYIAEFDSELAAKEDRIAQAEDEIARLKSEVRRYESAVKAVDGLSLRTGVEDNFYAGEFEYIVVSVLAAAEASLPEGSRRKHIIKSIVDANVLDDEGKKYRDSLKEILRGYKNLDAKTKRSLQEFGFSIQSEGRHHKLVFQDDGRYTYSLPKTASDHRSGLNLVSDISRQLF